MNDFTKEELQDIAGLIYYSTKGDDESIEEWNPLMDKLKSLIENYCDHIWTDGSGNNIFCYKCHIHGGKR